MDAFNYIENFIPDHKLWFDNLWTDLDWERRLDAPRREYWTNIYEKSYTYGRGAGRRTYEARPEHSLISTARTLISNNYDIYLEGCFLNGYENSRDWLGWHADDDSGIDHTKPIAIITIGAGRQIQFREVLIPAEKGITKGEYGPIFSLMLEPGSLCFMKPGMQSTHQHRIPKVDHEVGPRISLTFRGLMN